jgi:hypothetical protein
MTAGKVHRQGQRYILTIAGFGTVILTAELCEGTGIGSAEDAAELVRKEMKGRFNIDVEFEVASADS